MNISRRKLLLGTAATSLATFALPRSRVAWADIPASGKLRFGVIADVHQDVMHDGVERIGKFVADMTARKADFIFNLGDFCVPHDRNKKFLETWNTFTGPKFHVLGNHDTDGGYKREQTAEFYGMPKRFYSVDQQGVHFIVLDANDPDGKTKGYQAYVAPDQLDWLEKDLAATKLPVIVAVHQPIDCHDKSVKNAPAVRAVLATANKNAGWRQVLAVFCGHLHLDYVKVCDDIPHFQMNSASYYWVSKKHPNYDAAIQNAHPSIASTCPYVDPLWSFVTLDFERGELTLEGRSSTWVGGSPWDIGLKEDDFAHSRELCAPRISDRKLKLGNS